MDQIADMLPEAPPPEPPTRAAALRPRNAATLILIDRTRRTPKILMGRRHPGLAFMAGKFVFPGGRKTIWPRLCSTCSTPCCRIFPKAERASA